MPIHCQAGDIARVTFPNGTVQDFTGPVNVTVTPRYSSTNCASLRINVDVEIGAFGRVTGGFGVIPIFLNRNYFVYQSFNGFIFKNPYNGLSGGGILYGQLWAVCRGREASPWICYPLNEYRIGDESFGWTGQFRNLKVFRGTTELAPVTYTITITNLNGGQLFSGVFANSNYSVNCIAGCPPNSLDCGDCCLDCATVINGISSIRSLIARIK